MKVEFIIESAVKQGFDSEMVTEALVKADMAAIEAFVDELKQARFYKLNGAVIWHLLSVAQTSEQKRALDILGILLELSHIALSDVIGELGREGSPEAVALIRKALSSRVSYVQKWAAEEIITVQYKEKDALALQDESELVCRIAVKRLEKQDDSGALKSALENDFPFVRQTAAWYMGRKQVKEAVEPLIELVGVEDDTETLRAAIWSLSVLRDVRALPCIEVLCDHANPVIAAAAQEAASKLVDAK